ncbi:DUF1842 domain-containing protein [Burkholderia ubonensis]|uniref:DUF1842 domain-containing protein n=1 Tax=Burkholderia ubonensis TaxID=101571 RepID=UPI00075E8677|nr:DUF1842 domain-containing protein [Burkholderia ubonensis]AOI72637.1 hypothetical protein WI31_24050 [Burkholderia ubonensis]KUZ12123.1 hypothetical protein WI29_30210 [Burkholderia ubonensis]KUZ35447.1 hypothetical protein WI30_09925 [Burkholderia ubonensis]KUZ38971.1 hypothetical protein WI32_09960 [Burkholderia ubonensis]KUZ45434.1 hypothetical protein WI33_25690 [Burkholderia ubonensis]
MSEKTLAGLFPVAYVIGTEAPGAPTLRLALLVDTPERSVVGTATVTQAVNPPVEFHADVWGNYTYMALMPPANTRILVTLQGNDGGPNSNSVVTFKLQLVLESDWQRGVASYSYFDNGSWHAVENVPARIDREFVTLEPGPVIPSLYGRSQTLYGVSVHQATASGDLAHMKTVAAAANHQLQSRDEIAAALAALKAEIARLEAGH